MALTALLVPIVPFLVVGELPGQRWLMATEGHTLAFGATGAGFLAADLLLPIPSSVVGTLLGSRLGAGLGFLWAFAGLTAAALLGYAAGRLVPERFAPRLPTRPTAMLLFLSRPVPVFAEAMALSAGAARTPFSTYVASSTAGNALYAAAMALSGAHWLPGDWAGPGLVVPMLLPVASYLVWRRLST